MAELNKLFGVLSNLPPKAEVKAVELCVCGKKAIALDEIRTIVTPAGIRATDSTCRECLKMVDDFCRIVCVGCRRVVVTRSPDKFPDGFEFQKKGIQHVMGCPECNSDLKNELQSGKQVPLLTVEQQLFTKKYANINNAFAGGHKTDEI